MSEELKACPFCGGEATLVVPGSGAEPYVVCYGCYCQTSRYADKRNAIKAWNTRTPDPEIQRLREALERLASPEAFIENRVCTKEETARMFYAEEALRGTP